MIIPLPVVMLGKFLYSPHQYTLTSTGIMLGLLGMQFGYHCARDIRDEKLEHSN